MARSLSLRSTADFTEQVTAVILAVPKGTIVTYGEVALEAGFPGAARAVGTLLARSGNSLPWWRVVASNGRLVPGHEVEHRRRLLSEKVALTPSGRVKMSAQ